MPRSCIGHSRPRSPLIAWPEAEDSTSPPILRSMLVMRPRLAGRLSSSVSDVLNALFLVSSSVSAALFFARFHASWFSGVGDWLQTTLAFRRSACLLQLRVQRPGLRVGSGASRGVLGTGPHHGVREAATQLVDGQVRRRSNCKWFRSPGCTPSSLPSGTTTGSCGSAGDDSR